MAKLCDAEFATRTSISRQSALRIATEAEAQAEAHQHLSLGWLNSLHQASFQQAPVEATVLKLAHIMPLMKAIALKSWMTRRRGETCAQTNS